MQHHKSPRHVHAANERWRAAEARAERERLVGIPDREAMPDTRQPFNLPLACAGYLDLRIEPRRGYIAWRAVDERTGEEVARGALKSLLREIARRLPTMLSPMNQTH